MPRCALLRPRFFHLRTIKMGLNGRMIVVCTSQLCKIYQQMIVVQTHCATLHQQSYKKRQHVEGRFCYVNIEIELKQAAKLDCYVIVEIECHTEFPRLQGPLARRSPFLSIVTDKNGHPPNPPPASSSFWVVGSILCIERRRLTSNISSE